MAARYERRVASTTNLPGTGTGEAAGNLASALEGFSSRRLAATIPQVQENARSAAVGAANEGQFELRQDQTVAGRAYNTAIRAAHAAEIDTEVRNWMREARTRFDGTKPEDLEKFDAEYEGFSAGLRGAVADPIMSAQLDQRLDLHRTYSRTQIAKTLEATELKRAQGIAAEKVKELGIELTRAAGAGEMEIWRQTRDDLEMFLRAQAGEEDPAFSFVNQFHAETQEGGKGRKNADGSTTTVNTLGVEYNGKIYAVPGFDRETGKDLTEEQALKRYLPEIKSGRIEGLSPEEHNARAQENHRALEGGPDGIESVQAWQIPGILNEADRNSLEAAVFGDFEESRNKQGYLNDFRKDPDALARDLGIDLQLTQPQVDSLKRRMKTEIRAAEAAANERRRAAAAEKLVLQKAAESEARDLLARVEAGLPVGADEVHRFDSKATGLGMPHLGVALRQGVRFQDATRELATMGPKERQSKLDGMNPQTESGVRQYTEWQEAHAKWTEQQLDDPLAYKERVNPGSVPPLNPADPDSVATRLQISESVSAEYGIPAPLLTESELEGLKDILDEGDATDRSAVLNGLARGFRPGDPRASATAGMLDKIDPVAAAAFSVSAMGNSLLATEILQGPDAKETVGGAMPSAADGANIFLAPLAGQPEAAKSAKLAIDNAYATRAQKLGLTAFDPDVYAGVAKETLNPVEINGETTLAPAGVSGEAFERWFDGLDGSYIEAAGGTVLDPEIAARQIKRTGKLVPQSDGYMVVIEDAMGNPATLQSRNGGPFILPYAPLNLSGGGR